MLLTFSKTKNFETLIKQGIKIHTIREDINNRWKPGMKIHFWSGNPRNIKNNPYQFGEGIVSDIESICIYPDFNKIKICGNYFKDIDFLNMTAKNDGFKNWNDMKTWFKSDFVGRIIYWDYEQCNWF